MTGQQRELEKIADQILKPYFNNGGEYPILSPRQLRRRQEKEVPFSEPMMEGLQQEA